jgi:hypothetical protein
LVEVVRVYRIPESRHVHAAVYDADNDIVLRKRIADVGEIWTAAATVALFSRNFALLACA